MNLEEEIKECMDSGNIVTREDFNEVTINLYPDQHDVTEEFSTDRGLVSQKDITDMVIKDKNLNVYCGYAPIDIITKISDLSYKMAVEARAKKYSDMDSLINDIESNISLKLCSIILGVG